MRQFYPVCVYIYIFDIYIYPVNKMTPATATFPATAYLYYIGFTINKFNYLYVY